jgi:hypothetical protein
MFVKNSVMKIAWRLSGSHIHSWGDELPYRKAPNKSAAQMHAEAALGALTDAGLSFDNVDGYFCAGPLVSASGPSVLQDGKRLGGSKRARQALCLSTFVRATPPYTIAYVTLEEGPTMMTNIIDADPKGIGNRPGGHACLSRCRGWHTGAVLHARQKVRDRWQWESLAEFLNRVA